MPMKRTIFPAILVSAVLLWSCEETVVLDLDQVPEQVVIEALLTDVPGKQFVRVTKSASFYQSGQTNRVSAGVVSLQDDLGEKTSFFHHAGAKGDSVGYYLPSAGFAGKIDRTYTLTVQVDGRSYQASDKLARVTSIDSLSYRPNIFELRDPPSDGKIYELLVYAKEPQDTKDYYLVKYYRNDSLIYNGETDVYVFDDYGVGETIDGIPSIVHYAVEDKGRIEMYSISRNGFLFFNDLVIILNSDGGMFSPPPANPRSNFRTVPDNSQEGVLGFFQVSAVTSREIVVKE